MSPEGYVPLNLAGLAAGQILDFDLYQIHLGSVRLFRNAEVPLDQEDIDQLIERGCDTLWVPEEQQNQLIHFEIGALPDLLNDPEIGPTAKMEKLADVSARALGQVLREPSSESAVRGAVDQCHNHVDLAAGGEDEQEAMKEHQAEAPRAIAHALSVCNLAILLGIRLGLTDPKKLHTLATGALLHEVGKQLIDPRHYRRTDTRVHITSTRLRSYPVLGSQMLREHECVPREALRLIAEHQERPDGTGFPNRLSGSEVSLGARILAVCDVFDETLHVFPGNRPATPYTVLMDMKRRLNAYDKRVFEGFVRLLGTEEAGAASAVRSSGPACPNEV